MKNKQIVFRVNECQLCKIKEIFVLFLLVLLVYVTYMTGLLYDPIRQVNDATGLFFLILLWVVYSVRVNQEMKNNVANWKTWIFELKVTSKKLTSI